MRVFTCVICKTDFQRAGSNKAQDMQLGVQGRVNLAKEEDRRMTAQTELVDKQYRIESDQDAHAYRLDAFTLDGLRIAGAYRPLRLNDWRVFVTKQFVGELPQPSKVHVVSREDAVRWIDMLATLYVRSLP